jgi:HTH-type transcriptional regulator/antitoxin HipB
MIANERQYQSTKKKLQEFLDEKAQLELARSNDLLQLIHINAINAKVEDFQNELVEYELLKTGQLSNISFSIGNIHEIFIKARIAKGWSQADLASALDLREQQIQRYESLNYASANISKLKKISEALDIKFSHLTAQIKQPKFETGDLTQEQICEAQKKLSKKGSFIIT